MEEVDVEA